MPVVLPGLGRVGLLTLLRSTYLTRGTWQIGLPSADGPPGLHVTEAGDKTTLTSIAGAGMLLVARILAVTVSRALALAATEAAVVALLFEARPFPVVCEVVALAGVVGF